MTQTKTARFCVMFSFGSFATVGVKMEEGRSIAENLKARSADIVAYLDEATGRFITL